MRNDQKRRPSSNLLLPPLPPNPLPPWSRRPLPHPRRRHFRETPTSFSNNSRGSWRCRRRIRLVLNKWIISAMSTGSLRMRKASSPNGRVSAKTDRSPSLRLETSTAWLRTSPCLPDPHPLRASSPCQQDSHSLRASSRCHRDLRLILTSRLFLPERNSPLASKLCLRASSQCPPDLNSLSLSRQQDRSLCRVLSHPNCTAHFLMFRSSLRPCLRFLPSLEVTPDHPVLTLTGNNPCSSSVRVWRRRFMIRLSRRRSRRQ